MCIYKVRKRFLPLLLWLWKPLAAEGYSVSAHSPATLRSTPCYSADLDQWFDPWPPDINKTFISTKHFFSFWRGPWWRNCWCGGSPAVSQTLQPARPSPATVFLMLKVIIRLCLLTFTTSAWIPLGCCHMVGWVVGKRTDISSKQTGVWNTSGWLLAWQRCNIWGKLTIYD